MKRHVVRLAHRILRERRQPKHLPHELEYHYWSGLAIPPEARHEWVRAHPRQHAVERLGGGIIIAGVVTLISAAILNLFPLFVVAATLFIGGMVFTLASAFVKG